MSRTDTLRPAEEKIMKIPMMVQYNNLVAQQRNLKNVSINRLQRKHVQRNKKNGSPRSFVTSKGEFRHWGNQDVDRRIILRWIFRKLEGVLGTRWSWLRIWTVGGHLWVR
jgi:hypothetical protein